MELIVDTRESHIKDIVNPELNISIKNLDIGDFIFKQNDTILILIERKSINDLADSIKSGRYREQKLRILNSGIPLDRIIYLIEGTINNNLTYNGIPGKTLISSIINLLIRDNIKVIFTKNIDDTFIWLEKIYDKFNDPKYMNNISDNPHVQYLETIKTVKKQNLDSKNCFLLQLAQIPGVSIKYADAISKHYSSMVELIKAYNTDINTNRLLLSDIQINTSNNKTRKLGKIISTRIYNYLYHIDE